MGVIGFADTDVDALSTNDERVGDDFDRRREIEQVAAANHASA